MKKVLIDMIPKIYPMPSKARTFLNNQREAISPVRSLHEYFNRLYSCDPVSVLFFHFSYYAGHSLKYPYDHRWIYPVKRMEKKQ